MTRAIKEFINEITVDSKCSMDDLLTEFYKYAGMHISFKSIVADEQVKLRKILEEMDIHESFKIVFLNSFDSAVSPLSLYAIAKESDTIAEFKSVRRALEDIFRHPEATENMKNYVKIWLIQPLQIFGKVAECLGQLLFDDEQMLHVAMKDPKMFSLAVKKAFVLDEDFSLISFIVANDMEVPARVYSRTEEVLALDIAGLESLSDIRTKICTIELEDMKGPGDGLDGLMHSTNCILKIHHAYPTMQANMINYSTRNINTTMSGGARLSAKQVVDLYSGNYSEFEQGGSGGENISSEFAGIRGLITNPDAFNRLSASGKSLVAQYLPATRKQFNQIVVNAINSIHTWMPQLMNAKTNNQELNRVISGLSKSFNAVGNNQQGMVDWFMHKFAPAVNAYRARNMAPTGIAVVDNVFCGSPMKQTARIYGSGMHGGSPVIRTVYVNRNSSETPRVFGGGPIGDYIDGMRKAQMHFNEQFDKVYRNLTTAVQGVANHGNYKIEDGLSAVIDALTSVSISSKKTVMKISGLRQDNDLNSRYTSMVEHAIKTIEGVRISGFGEVISCLRSLISALKTVKEEGIRLRKRVAEASKSAEEYIKYIDVDKEEIPSKLTSYELHALTEAINALMYTNRGNEMTAKTERVNDNAVKEFLSRVTKRSELIKDHYDRELRSFTLYKRVDNDTHTLLSSHIASISKVITYFNETIDVKLVQWRQKLAKQGNITKEQLSEIEKLTVTYMNYRPGEKLINLFTKLEKLRQTKDVGTSVSGIYKVFDVIRQIVMHSGYVELIRDMYTTLGINDPSFDWNTFKVNLARIITDQLFVIDDGRMKVDGVKYANSIGIGKLTEKIMQDLFAMNPTNVDANTIKHRNLITMVVTSDFLRSMAGIENSSYSIKLHALVNNNWDRCAPTIPDGMTSQQYLTKKFNDFGGAGAATDIPLSDANDLPRLVSDIKYKIVCELFDNLSRTQSSIIDYPEELIHSVAGTIAQNLFSVVDGEAEVIAEITGDEKPYLDWNMYSFEKQRESQIITGTIHAMISNILHVINKYIAVRYTGSMALPISTAMLGGDAMENASDDPVINAMQMHAGSAIDMISVHDLEFDRVIPEAAPFYVIALSLFDTFIQEWYKKYSLNTTDAAGNVHADEDKGKFHIFASMSEFSMLYPIYKLTQDYNIASASHFTDFQLKSAFAALNKIWNIAPGSGKEKLMNAIDYVLGEINQSLIYTSRHHYEHLKAHGAVELSSEAAIDQQFEDFVQDISKIVNENMKIQNVTDPDALRDFETFLTNSVEKVRKETNDVARINVVKSMLDSTEANKFRTPLDKYYKFCEFVITPIMIAASSYKALFQLFSSLASERVTVTNNTVDLKNIWIATKKRSNIFFEEAFADMVDEEHPMNCWLLCERIRKSDMLSADDIAAAASLVNSAVVARWNTILITNALHDRASGRVPRFTLPDIWMPLVPESYPKQSTISVNIARTKNVTDAGHSEMLLRQLFPTVKSDNVIDYYNCLLSEFTADFDHLYHTFVSFPGISDRFLSKLKDALHNKVISLKDIIAESVEGKSLDASAMRDLKMHKLSSINLPDYPSKMQIPPYVGTVNVPAVGVSTAAAAPRADRFRIGTSGIVLSSYNANERREAGGNFYCDYGFIDWVIYKIASCNRVEYTIPAPLYELFKTNTVIGKFMVECVTNTGNGTIVYTPKANGVYYNIVTQNILTRSATDRNRNASADAKNMSKLWVANLVSEIPHLLLSIKSTAAATAKGYTDVEGNNYDYIFTALTTILESYYEEIVQQTPFIPFMSDFVPGTLYTNIESKISKFHSIAEVLKIMEDDEIPIGIKTEWANRYYYANGMNLTFPDYKQRDKFESIKKWGSDVFNNSLFSSEFEGSIGIIARSMMRKLTINEFQDSYRYSMGAEDNNMNRILNNRELINLCIRIIARGFELDPLILSEFIENIFQVYNDQENPLAMVGGYSAIPFAAAAFPGAAADAAVVDLGTKLQKLFNRIFQVGNDSIVAYDYPAGGAQVSLNAIVNDALSLLYDIPNTRPLYALTREGADMYKQIAPFVGNNVATGAYKVHKFAVSGNESNYATRSGNLLSFAAVNVKNNEALDDADPGHRPGTHTGTIQNAARYIGRSPNDDVPGLTTDAFITELRKLGAINIEKLLDKKPRVEEIWQDDGTNDSLKQLINGYSAGWRDLLAIMLYSRASYCLNKVVFNNMTGSRYLDQFRNRNKMIYSLLRLIDYETVTETRAPLNDVITDVDILDAMTPLDTLTSRPYAFGNDVGELFGPDEAGNIGLGSLDNRRTLLTLIFAIQVVYDSIDEDTPVTDVLSKITAVITEITANRALTIEQLADAIDRGVYNNAAIAAVFPAGAAIANSNAALINLFDNAVAPDGIAAAGPADSLSDVGGAMRYILIYALLNLWKQSTLSWLHGNFNNDGVVVPSNIIKQAYTVFEIGPDQSYIKGKNLKERLSVVMDLVSALISATFAPMSTERAHGMAEIRTIFAIMNESFRDLPAAYFTKDFAVDNILANHEVGDDATVGFNIQSRISLFYALAFSSENTGTISLTGIKSALATCRSAAVENAYPLLLTPYLHILTPANVQVAPLAGEDTYTALSRIYQGTDVRDGADYLGSYILSDSLSAPETVLFGVQFNTTGNMVGGNGFIDSIKKIFGGVKTQPNGSFLARARQNRAERQAPGALPRNQGARPAQAAPPVPPPVHAAPPVPPPVQAALPVQGAPRFNAAELAAAIGRLRPLPAPQGQPAPRAQRVPQQPLAAPPAANPDRALNVPPGAAPVQAALPVQGAPRFNAAELAAAIGRLRPLPAPRAQGQQRDPNAPLDMAGLMAARRVEVAGSSSDSDYDEEESESSDSEWGGEGMVGGYDEPYSSYSMLGGLPIPTRINTNYIETGDYIANNRLFIPTVTGMFNRITAIGADKTLTSISDVKYAACYAGFLSAVTSKDTCVVVDNICPGILMAWATYTRAGIDFGDGRGVVPRPVIEALISGGDTELTDAVRANISSAATCAAYANYIQASMASPSSTTSLVNNMPFHAGSIVKYYHSENATRAVKNIYALRSRNTWNINDMDVAFGVGRAVIGNDAPPAAAEESPGSGRIAFNVLPTIIAPIKPHRTLNRTSVLIYSALLSKIGEYALWNPGYELFNIYSGFANAADRRVDMVRYSPYDAVVNTPFIAFRHGEQDAMLCVNNEKAFSIGALSVGILAGNYLKFNVNGSHWYRDAPAGLNGIVSELNAATELALYTPADRTLAGNNVTTGPKIKTGKAKAVIDKIVKKISTWCEKISTVAPKESAGFTLNMMGGAIPFGEYVDYEAATGGEPYEIYKKIYPCEEDISYKLPFYDRMFRGVARSKLDITSLALKYFNRTMISFGGILSNFLFPNAIYGEACFNNFVAEFSRTVHDTALFEDASFKNNYGTEYDSVGENRWKFYKVLLEYFAKSGPNGQYRNASNAAFYYTNQLPDAGGSPEKNVRLMKDMRITEFVNRFTAAQDKHSMLASEYTMPSICNSYLSYMHNILVGKSNQAGSDLIEAKNTNLAHIINTDAMGIMRSIDSSLTYLSAVANLVKYMSFYDVDEKRERPYAGIATPEPYAGVETF